MSNPSSNVPSKIKLIVSDEPNPSLPKDSNNKMQVQSVSVVTPDMKESGAIAARLCGGTGTCLALVEL